MDTADLEALVLDPKLVAKVGKHIVLRGILPLRFDEKANVLHLVMEDTEDLHAIDTLRYRLGCKVEAARADGKALRAVIKRHYGGEVEQMLDDMAGVADEEMQAEASATTVEKVAD